MARFLYRLGAFGVRNRVRVAIGWLIAVAAIAAIGLLFPGTLESSNNIPGSPAQIAYTKMNQHFPDPDVQSARIVFRAPDSTRITDPAFARTLAQTLDATGEVPGVTSVSDPVKTGMVSPDKRTAVVDVTFSTANDVDVPPETLAAVEAGGAQLRQAGVHVVYGGDAFADGGSPVHPSEGIGVLIAFAVLIITFGSMVAAGLPLLTALAGVVATITAMMGLSSLFGISDKAPTLAVMLGLAVGIDYALFIVSRHRTYLAGGTPVGESVARSTATAGSAVIFAGATVVIALIGLAVAGVPTLSSMGFASATGVAVAVVMSLGLLPALLAIAGRRLTPKPGSRAARRVTQTAKPSMGVRWVGWVSRHPVRTLVSVTLLLLAIATPAMHLTLALGDEGSDPKTTATRQTYDLVADAFGPGANGPLAVLIEGSDSAQVTQTATAVQRRMQDVPGIADISRIDMADDNSAARIRIISAHGPTTEETSRLVTDLRAVLAPISASTGQYVAVTGITAVSIDVSEKLGDALVPFSVVVVGLSLLLLMVAFRSIAIPIKATVGFLLSVAASLGATVAVFQWGWLSGVLGVSDLGPIASFVPIIVMAVLFGLAMDYEVFLVSAIQEDYTHHRDARRALMTGAQHSVRVVTAAALIMIAVFAGFLLSHDPDIMPIAFALAFGILVDAFLVRMTLGPAVHAMLGDRAWWLPRPLARILPKLDLEGASVKAADARRPDEDEPSASRVPV